jgi:hypothetical protein
MLRIAGSFSFEKEHYDISMRIGKMRLFPATVNAPAAPANTQPVAAEMSGREQIRQPAGRKSRHPEELLAGILADTTGHALRRPTSSG